MASPRRISIGECVWSAPGTPMPKACGALSALAATNTAARPTSEWKAATSWGSAVITMRQTFATVVNYPLLAAQDADIAIPHVRASAHGEDADYKTNVALSDAVFTKKN